MLMDLTLPVDAFRYETGTQRMVSYGHVGTTFEERFATLAKEYQELEQDYFQSNVEGELINSLHEEIREKDSVILNAGAYTHTSVALGDAIKAIDIPVIEVHIRNVSLCEDFRHVSYIASYCKAFIIGFGMDSHRLALKYYAEMISL